MPRLLLVLVLAALGASAAAQPSIQLRAGYDHYRLNDLRASQDGLQAEFRHQGIPIEAISTFPAYLSLQLNAAVPLWGGHRGGISLGTGSTGARSHYADYSGEIRADWVAARRSVGVFVEQDAIQRRDFTGIVAIHFGADYAQITYDAAVQVGNESETFRQEITGRGFYLQPEVSAEWPIHSAAFVRVGVGYGLTLRGGFGLFPQTTYRPEWTGWRLGVTFGLRAPSARLSEDSANLLY